MNKCEQCKRQFDEQISGMDNFCGARCEDEYFGRRMGYTTYDIEE
jgi:hypothetical protein